MSDVHFEASLIKVLVTKTNWDLLHPFVDLESLPVEICPFIEGLGMYHLKHPDSDGTVESFGHWFMSTYVGDKPRSIKETYKEVLLQADKAPQIAVESLITTLREKAAYSKIQEILDGDPSLLRITAALAELEKAPVLHKAVVMDLEMICKATSRAYGLQWRLDCLNRSIGPLIPGDFVVIAAYVNTGKTALAISEVTHMATQITDGHVLFLNNEEHSYKIVKKIYQSTLNLPADVLESKIDQHMTEYKDALHGDPNRIKVFDICGWSLDEIRVLLEQENPKMVVIDQIDNIVTQTKKNWREDQRLGFLYAEIRNLAKKHCPIIAVTQTDATASYQNKEGDVIYKRNLDMRQLAGSKVSKQATADFIITIGKDKNFPHTRYLNTPKNKSDAAEEHSRELHEEPVVFNGRTIRYENIR